MTNDKLHNIVIEQYNKVRSDPKTSNEVIEYLKSIDSEAKKITSNRLMSFLVLKNDLILQEDLTYSGVVGYVDDLKYCIDNKVYTIENGDQESIFKLFEMIAKIQIAINLLGLDLSMKHIYEDILLEFNENFEDFFSYFKGNKIRYDNYQLIFMYDIQYLFISDFHESMLAKSMKDLIRNYTYKHIIFRIFHYLNEHKDNYYKKRKRLFADVGLLKYQFVYE